MTEQHLTEDFDLDEFLVDDEFREAFEDAEFRATVLSALRSVRKGQKLTQRDVAQAMGTSQSAVSDLENGGDPYFSTLQRYARAVGAQLRIVVDSTSSNVTSLTSTLPYANRAPSSVKFQPKEQRSTPLHSVERAARTASEMTFVRAS
ncbi:hypothetical protein HMPREF1219_01500 [Corynebacterium pyruviciproducens ATCC BAA-1742]|uniref:HTH cro/C1-type domain-containing protein n=1 Tax=Corynebacterium pyruviciproducens ATCC BAA-1742 TaxID=1125779 RepID=S2Z4Y9_9CORY|nr:helix-turn-helix transcriptional regulator [Corynebacterium pyruviciproducens]EPD69275.1 hypothetical protein HMPREF1219_01500 [Corynebacterium pyruviciproducens ATCC BAA-1742]MDK7214730.1 helix-turn-helix transcriptional regulator [Corynebacterium pyruviciproducens]